MRDDYVCEGVGLEWSGVIKWKFTNSYAAKWLNENDLNFQLKAYVWKMMSDTLMSYEEIKKVK